MRILTPIALLATVLFSWAPAQDAETKYQQKLEKDFMGKIEWVTTLSAAQEAAKEKKSLIYGYFTRSYAP